jgi:hypothetical protein
MSSGVEVSFVLARCSHGGQGFSIEFRRSGRGNWTATRAFEVSEQAAKRGGYEPAEISGTIEVSPAFSGCPHCRSVSFYLCSCGKVACWDGESRSVTCPWCRHVGELGGPIESLRSVRDY